MLREVYDLTPEERKSHEEKWGRYNDYPSNWRELTEQEFAQSWFWLYCWNLYEFRQMGDSVRGYQAARLFFLTHFNMGFAMANEWRTGKVRYFQFGCDHAWKEISQAECHTRKISHFGRCYHVSVCEKCGNVWAVDSSD